MYVLNICYKTDKSSENAGVSLCCFIAATILNPTELNLLQVILGGASRMSCQTQVRLLSLTEHHITYSTTMGNLLGVNYLP